MQSQVKGPLEHKDVWTQFFKSKDDRRIAPGMLLGCSQEGTWDSSNSDDDLELHGKYLTQQEMLIKKDTFNIARCGEVVNLENNTDNMCSTKQDISPSKPCVPTKGFWRVSKPKTQLFREEEVLVRNGKPGMDIEIQRSNITDSHTQSCLPSEGLAAHTASKLWRIDSLESLCSNGSSLSLAERVEINRTTLRQMLQKSQKNHSDGCNTAITVQTLEDQHSKDGLKDSKWDSGICLPDCKQNQSDQSFVELSLSPHHEQAKLQSERARMKARSNPLKADHTILPVQRDKPELLSWVGAPVQLAALVGTERVVLGSGSLSDSSSSESTGGHQQRRIRGQSPTRVRFQDESENDAEVRYLERQHRQTGERTRGLLGTKPCLESYINGKSSEISETWKQKIRRSQESLASANDYYDVNAMGRQCNSCGTILNAASSEPLKKSANGEAEGRTVQCWVAPTLPNRLVRIEQIKETYIGAMSTNVVESDAICNTSNVRGTLERKRMNRVREGSPENDNITDNELVKSGSPSFTKVHLSNGSTALPFKPFAPNLMAGRTFQSPANIKKTQPISVPPRPVSPPLQPRKTALNIVSKEHSNGQQGITLMPSQYHLTYIHSEEKNGKRSNLEGIPQGNPLSPGHVMNSRISTLKYPSVSSNPNRKSLQLGHCGSQPTGLEQDQIRVEIPANAADISYDHLNNVEHHRSVSTEQQRDDSISSSSTTTLEVKQKEGRAHQVLNRFFSAMGLKSGGRLAESRSSSMEQLSPPLKPSTQITDPPGPSHTLKKAPSLQSLLLGTPLGQLKKFSSMQNLHAGRRKPERSNAYTPGERPCSPALTRSFQRALSVEDVGSPSAMHSVGRVVQAFPDGTFLLELDRPLDGPFGFLISRGKGRQDTGVYVEQISDSSTQKLYTGLLGVGDEILEVNGEKVAGLSLELVTELMIQQNTASIRVLRHRMPHR